MKIYLAGPFKRGRAPNAAMRRVRIIGPGTGVGRKENKMFTTKTRRARRREFIFDLLCVLSAFVVNKYRNSRGIRRMT